MKSSWKKQQQCNDNKTLATGETVMCMPEHVCVPTVKHGLHVKGVETAATTTISCYNVLSIVIATTTQNHIDTFVWMYVCLYCKYVRMNTIVAVARTLCAFMHSLWHTSYTTSTRYPVKLYRKHHSKWSHRLLVAICCRTHRGKKLKK